MLTAFAALFIGFVVLVWSADKFVFGASATASSFDISPLVVGVVIVGLGTSAPEMLVSAMAAVSGNSELSVGNALGSNITNIGLILGITALLIPLQVQSRIIKQELPLMLAVCLFGSALLYDRQLSLLDGCLLLGGFVALLIWSMRTAASNPDDVLSEEFSQELAQGPSRAKALFWLITGMALLIVSSRILVWGAVNIATFLGISDLVIGLTIVAIGTSLPELAASVAAARKQEFDIAIGNVVGSNMFNLLGVMALPAVIAPGAVSNEVFVRDVPMMLGLAMLLWLFSSNFSLRNNGTVTRLQGAILLAIYAAYITYLVITNL